ncbi:MAG TPA: glycosyl hydrolase [Blastocatellia bacterium]|nr:glycosyl hydrolase [Blastocatellia bacterium]
MKSTRTGLLLFVLALLAGVAFAALPVSPAAGRAAVKAGGAVEGRRAVGVAAQPNLGQQGESAKSAGHMKPETFAGLALRSIGPAVTSGRVVDFAVDPANRAHYFVASASGGVWKTTNGGTTFTPVFDKEGSYSIGVVVLDPKNSSTVWVGTGENNSQRSVAYGDGVYRSDDGGKSWKNMGLKHSEHIGRIAIDPKNTDIVYVAAQGPLWNRGGDRGLYKTTDGGKTWKNLLSISENTGVTDVAIDPRDSSVVYAASYQRRRKVFSFIDGGPESALYKSTDAGASWAKLKAGLPAEDLGRIGLAISPADPDVVYATVEAANKKGGVFRSTDRGATWERRNPFDEGAMYYGHVFADPKNVDRIYITSVLIRVSDDGGKTIRLLGEKDKHVDNHVIWIDPNDTSYYLAGCDGGIYESFDRGETWAFKANLPVTQFYDIDADNSKPFYFVYGGTQDNYSLGGPSRTKSASGITNSDWFVTQGGDGFKSVIDPEDPNTVYAELQYGELIRFDKPSGERLSIKPQEGKGEPPLRWNWDSPIIVSPHSHTRLYFAANKLFRSEDRGDSWKPVSGELSRGIDVNTLPIMGRIWGPDAVAKGQSTSFYGNCTALAESPKKEGLVYAGTDDGVINITEDGGGSWRRDEKFTGVPEMTYVTRVVPSNHDAGTVYAAFDNHKNGDFAPYLLKSADSGKSWTSIKGNLPENGPVLALAEDPVDPNLLFAGTEFGLFFTDDGGGHWVQLKGGMPVISVHDLVIQKRENDLLVATFGRGIYILDDYTPLRNLKAPALDSEAVLFPVKDAPMYIESRPLGGRGKGFQGEAFFTSPNPPFGATFTYYLKDALKTRKQKRQEAEKAAEKRDEKPEDGKAAGAGVEKSTEKDGKQQAKPVPYPTGDELRAEAEEQAPQIVLTVTDDSGQIVRKLTGPVAAGIHRVSWDLRYPAALLPPPSPAGEGDSFFQRPAGPLVMPGKFTVAVSKLVDGKLTPIAGPQSFSVVVEGVTEMPEADRKALVEFQRKAERLERAVVGAIRTATEIKSRMAAIHRALDETPSAGGALFDEAASIDTHVEQILRALNGDEVLQSYSQNTPSSISDRIGSVIGGQRLSTARPTQTQIDSYQIAAGEFGQQLSSLRTLVEVDLVKLEKDMEAAGAPWTPGHLPDWKDQ